MREKHSTFHFLPSMFSKGGFTLVETIIYIALFSIMTSFVLAVFYQLIGSYDQNKNRIEVDQEANFLMQKLLWALTGAEIINQPTAGATSTSLSLSKYTYGQNPIVFDVAAQNLRISKASSPPVQLGSRKIFVTEFLAEHVPAVQSAPEGVKIRLGVISSDITRPQASTTLKNTIYLR